MSALWPLSLLIGYSLGAIPTGVIVSRLGFGLDVRRSGSGHTGGTNVMRVTGKTWAGLLTVLIDIGLGALSIWVTRVLFGSPWAPAMAGAAAVLGHSWSAYIGFAGGIGLSSLFGMLLAQAPLETLIAGIACALVWLAMRKLLKHDARSTIFVLPLLPLLLWLGQPLPIVVSAGVGALFAIVKSLGDWRRVQKRNDGTLGQFGLQRTAEME